MLVGHDWAWPARGYVHTQTRNNAHRRSISAHTHTRASLSIEEDIICNLYYKPNALRRMCKDSRNFQNGEAWFWGRGPETNKTVHAHECRDPTQKRTTFIPADIFSQSFCWTTQRTCNGELALLAVSTGKRYKTFTEQCSKQSGQQHSLLDQGVL